MSELAKTLPVIEKGIQSSYIGGGDGTYSNPYTLGDYQALGSSFTKGWVEMSPGFLSYMQGDYHSFFGGSDYDGSAYWGGSDYVDVSYGGTSDYSGTSEWSNHSDFGCKPSCVFNCYIYLSGGLYDTCDFYQMTKSNLGYEPNEDGGVLTADIPIIGSFAGFCVEELSSGIRIKADGKTLDGRDVMMTFNDGAIDHAVIVTGHIIENGIKYITYHDPTRNEDNKISLDKITGLYGVGIQYVDSPIGGTSYNSSYA